MAVGDLFKQLLPFKWDDVSFPVTEMKISVTHDLAEHKYWGQDGSKVEATGRQALAFDARIPFRNGIFAGRGEKWDPFPLYPNGFRAFLAKAVDRKTKVLQHPELGPIKCKLRSCHVAWSGARQDGVDVDVSWIETYDETAEYNIPTVEATVAAGDLDNAVSSDELRKLAPKLPKYKPTLADSVRSVGAALDSVSVLSKRVNGKIENLAYQVETISDSMKSARNALTWPVDRACTRLADALTDLRQELASSGKTLVIYTVPVTMGLAALTPVAGGDLAAIIRLNPHLVRTGIVKAGRTVKYFAQKNT